MEVEILKMEVYSESAVINSLPVKKAERVKAPKVMLFLAGDNLNGNKTIPQEIFYDLQKQDNRKVEILDTRRRQAGNYWRFISRLLRTIPNYDIIHIYISSFESFLKRVWPIIVISKFFGHKIMLSYISADTELYLEKWAKIFRPIISQADRIIVPSKYTSDIFNRYGYRAETLPRCIDIQSFNYKFRNSVQPKILVNRSLEMKNNIPAALKAFQLVKQKYPRAEIVIIGEGSLKDDLKALVKKERINGVYFIGRVAPKDMADYYDIVDLFVNPSTIDDFPVSLIEAMASGLPVITTDAGGILEMVTDGENALVVPINSHVVIADRIIELIENKALVAELSQKARENAARFDWTNYQNNLAGLYRSLMVS